MKVKHFIKLNNREWLADQYITRNRTLIQIAIELECSESNVRIYLRKFGLRKMAKKKGMVM